MRAISLSSSRSTCRFDVSSSLWNMSLLARWNEILGNFLLSDSELGSSVFISGLVPVTTIVGVFSLFCLVGDFSWMHLLGPVINLDLWSLSFEACTLCLSDAGSCLLFLLFSPIVCWTGLTWQAVVVCTNHTFESP